jgi:large subunit ribosomal protein L5
MLGYKSLYAEKIKPELQKELSLNAMLVPEVTKIVISVGMSEGAKDKKLMQNVADTVSLIAGQKAIITKSKKSIAGFKLRDGMDIGVKVTLRKNNMYNFLEKLIKISLPRVRDFKGLNPKGFDKNGNYNFGLTEQLIFPEVNYDDIVKIHGMNITIETSASNDADGKRLLEMFGFPFAKK